MRACGRSGVVLALGLAVLAGSAGAQTVSDPELSLETVVTGLSGPTQMAFLGRDDILVNEKNTGRVRRVLDGTLLPGFVLDVPVNAASERGLLGLAINSEDPPGVFLYYTEAAVQGGSPIANRVYRYTWNPGTGMLENPSLILDLPVLPGPNHNAGIVLLGNPGEGPPVGDGAFLYAVIGDLNRDNQLENFPNGDPPDDTAVIFRVLQDGTPAPGNPFAPYCSATTTQPCSSNPECPGGETCVLEVARYYAYGVRNSFGMALDPVTGRLWDTENGPASYDEINLIEPGTNSGWEKIMGPDARDPQGVGDLFDIPSGGSTYSDPEFSWFDTIAPTAILFPFSSRLGASYGDVALVADNNLSQIYALPLNGARDGFDFAGFAGVADLVADSDGERDQFLFGEGFGAATDLEIGPDGALYVLSIGHGAIYRITGPAPAVPALGVAPLALAAGAILLAAGRALRASAQPG